MKSILFLLFLALTLPAQAQTRPEVEAYSIPSDAETRGPAAIPRYGQFQTNYFPAGAEITRKTMIGRDTYFFKTLIKRELFKDGKRHGVQREWHENGQLKSEAPYYEGAMDGLFRHWDEKGQLVGQYQIKGGVGTAKIYSSDGAMLQETHFENNREDGIGMEFFELTGDRSLVRYKNGGRIDKAYSFYRQSQLRSMAFFSDTGLRHGPYLEFNNVGELTNKKWRVNGSDVTEQEYSKAAAADTTLPPYYEDASRYKAFVTDEVKALLKKYQEMPRVKIPLEFDGNGNPVLAPMPAQ